MNTILRFLCWLWAGGAILALAGGGAGQAQAASGPTPAAAVAAALDRLAEVTGEAPFQSSYIFDRHGNLLYELSDKGRRTIIALEQTPLHLRQATIATEDKNFYNHTGVDYTAIARAAWQNMQAEEVVSGASTITQQLARTLLLDAAERYELTFQRKLKEANLAFDLETRYTKPELLEMYLNSVYYGHQAYGIAAAAATYFRKSVSDLTLAESALLAGLPQSPLAYDPLIDPEAALARQRVVLDLMQRQGYISGAEKEQALAQTLRFIPPALPVLRAPHFVDYVRGLLLERYGSEGMRQGLYVHTSIDLRYQQLAESVARAQIAELGPSKGMGNAAVVILAPATGEVLAMVGSADYYDAAIDGQVNMATSKRQPGSAIKPVLYTAALQQGWTPASILWDTAAHYPLGDGRYYLPANITGRFYGPTRVRFALANSLNVPAVKLLGEIGPAAMLDMASRLGIDSLRAAPEDYGLSLAVGGYEITLLELTHAFATLANQGVHTRLQPVTRIEDRAGRALFQADPAPQQVVSPQIAYQISDILSDTRARQAVFGPRSALNTSQPTAVKTGTTDGWRDNLTVGYTRYVAVGVWMGNSNGTPMQNAMGSQTAAPVWHDLMEAIWATPSLHPTLGFVGQPLPQGFEEPPGLLHTPICDLRGYNISCPRAYEEILIPPATADAAEPPATSGFCLPTLAEELPLALQYHARFVPLPRTQQDRAAAREWGIKHDLGLRTVDACTVTLHRAVAAAPALPAAQRLIFIPETRPQPGGLWPGNSAVIVDNIPGLNIRQQAGQNGLILGSLKPGQIAILRQGPEMVEGAPWFEMRAVHSGLTGWVNGRYLTPLPPPDATAAAAAQP